MTRRMNATVATVALAMLAAPAAAVAGSDNVLYLSQDGSSNTIHVDQSNASGSTVGGLTLPSDLSVGNLTPSNLDGTNTPARQSGFNNSADVTIAGSGSGGEAGLLQDNSSSPIHGNTATLALGTGAFGLVAQLGDRNNANLNVSGSNAFGGIVQNGSDNTAGLTVSDSGVTGKLVQNGDNNTAGLVVSGTPGTTVTYQVNGSNAYFATNAQVITNGATVLITQTP